MTSQGVKRVHSFTLHSTIHIIPFCLSKLMQNNKTKSYLVEFAQAISIHVTEFTRIVLKPSQPLTSPIHFKLPTVIKILKTKELVNILNKYSKNMFSAKKASLFQLYQTQVIPFRFKDFDISSRSLKQSKLCSFFLLPSLKIYEIFCLFLFHNLLCFFFYLL